MGVDVGDLTAAACANCAACALKICKAASLVLPSYEPITEVRQAGFKEGARRVAVHAGDMKDEVAFLCNGWASRSTTVPNGRQLLSVLLPGDIVSAQLAVGQSDGWFIDSITDITYRLFYREDVHNVLKKQPEARTTLFNVVAQEIKRADDFIVHLGRGSAEQRIAYLVTSVLNRLQKLGMARADATSVPFPLRQHHIADATGLTSVHVSNILGDFRRRGMIELADRTLKIRDWKQLLKLSALHTR
jgi:CRP/FNR family transcriptional regulator, anaerobic regulatory protein